MDIKGVVSLDFMLASFMIILIIPCILSIAMIRMDTVESADQMVSARTLTENVAETIDLVYSGGEGCSAVYCMPLKIKDIRYTLTVHPTEVVIVFNGKMGGSHHSWVGIYDGSGFRSNYNLESGVCYNISNVKIDNQNVLIFHKIKK